MSFAVVQPQKCWCLFAFSICRKNFVGVRKNLLLQITFISFDSQFSFHFSCLLSLTPLLWQMSLVSFLFYSSYCPTTTIAFRWFSSPLPYEHDEYGTMVGHMSYHIKSSDITMERERKNNNKKKRTTDKIQPEHSYFGANDFVCQTTVLFMCSYTHFAVCF